MKRAAAVAAASAEGSSVTGYDSSTRSMIGVRIRPVLSVASYMTSLEPTQHRSFQSDSYEYVNTGMVHESSSSSSASEFGLWCVAITGTWVHRLGVGVGVELVEQTLS